MKLTYLILHEEKLIMERFAGDVDLYGLLRAVQGIWADSDFDKTYRGLLDLQSADLHLSFTEISDLVSLLDKSPESSQAPFGILVSKPFETTLAKMFEAKMQPLQHVGVFSEPQDLFDFLEKPVSLFELLNSPIALQQSYPSFVNGEQLT